MLICLNSLSVRVPFDPPAFPRVWCSHILMQNRLTLRCRGKRKKSSKQLSCTVSELVGKIIMWARACHKRNGLLLWEHLHQRGPFYRWERQPFTKSCVLWTRQLTESANSLTGHSFLETQAKSFGMLFVTFLPSEVKMFSTKWHHIR